jgi:hypothetical protein
MDRIEALTKRIAELERWRAEVLERETEEAAYSSQMYKRMMALLAQSNKPLSEYARRPKPDPPVH